MIRKEIQTEFTSLVPILEIGIGNEIKDPDTGAFDFKKAQIISLAYFYGKSITILQKEKTDQEYYWKEQLKKELLQMPICYSNFNLKEKDAISGYLGLNRFVESISLVRGKGISKDNLFRDLFPTKEQQNKWFPFPDPFEGDTLQIVHSYMCNKYEDIIKYFVVSLIKQHLVFIHRWAFVEKYQDSIRNGWFQGEFGK